MTEIVGRVAVEVVADTSRLEAGLQGAQKQAQTLDQNAKRSMDSVTKSMQGATVAAAGLAQGFTHTTQSANQTRQATQSLVQSMQGLSQSMLGANVVAFALGAAMGGFLQATVMQLVAGVSQAIQQFNTLRNELATVPSLMANVGQEFAFVQQVAQTSTRSLEELTRSYIELSREAERAGVSQEQLRRIFAEWERTLAQVQQQGLRGGFGQVLTNVGGLVAALDETLRISGTLLLIINGMRTAFQFLRNLIPQATDALSDQGTQLRINEERVANLRKIIAAMQAETNRDAARSQLLTQYRYELQNVEAAIRRIQELQRNPPMSPEVQLRLANITGTLSRELEHQVSVMRMSRLEQDIANRTFQLREQLMSAGVPRVRALAEAEAAAANIRRAVLAGEFQGLRDSLLSSEALEMQSFQRRTEMIQGFLNSRLISQQEHDALMEAEFFRSNVAMQQIQQQAAAHLITAQMGAGQALLGVLNQLQGKSKAAAVAAIAVNTALQVAQAIQNTAAASTRALAELGPIAGPPAAAAISAWGATQVGLIIAAGALQGAGALSKGGPAVPSAGGGGAALPAPMQDEDRRAPTIISVEGIDPSDMFSGQVLIDLATALNESVQNGNVVISTRNLGSGRNR